MPALSEPPARVAAAAAAALKAERPRLAAPPLAKLFEEYRYIKPT